jgi:hypothetical protein
MTDDIETDVQDQDEPQTIFFPPAEGGSYVRNEDGSLSRVEGPTLPPNPEPQE